MALRWNRIYRATSYARSALWIVPIVAIAAVLALAPLVRMLDRWIDWPVTGLDVDGARALFDTAITLTLSFIVFTFGSLLVAIQVSGGQLTPRIIATILLRDNVVRYTVGLFTFTLLMSITAQNRMQAHVPQIVVLLVTILGVACMVMFLFLIDYAARLLRPVSILARVGEMGVDVINTVYRDRLATVEPDEEPSPANLGKAERVVANLGASEVVLAIELDTLVAEARRVGGVIEVVPQVGQFVGHGEPLLNLHGGASRLDDGFLTSAVALGPERTLEQDPMFAFRIIVDIGLKALSPAINDPTTAVLAIDQVQRLLGAVGRRRLASYALRDAEGQVRVLFRTPDWDDYVHIACTEIRSAGAGQVQVARRLAAMFEHLPTVLPAHRHAALARERGLLARSLEGRYDLPEDLALARVPDVQGLGGSSP